MEPPSVAMERSAAENVREVMGGGIAGVFYDLTHKPPGPSK